MAETAPFFSPDQLTGAPGDANLSGVEVNFDPNNKNPLGAMQDTLSRVDAESAAAIQQKRQQVFQMQQQQRNFQNDLLAQAAAHEANDNQLKYKQNIEDRNSLYKMLSTGKASAFNMKDEQGNDMSFQPLPEDNEYLIEGANSINQDVTKNGSFTDAMNSADFQKKFREHEAKVKIASVRAVTLTQLNQELAKTGDPLERERIAKSIKEIKETPLSKMSLPEPHTPGNAVKSMLGDNLKDYPQQKGYESFDGPNGERLIGRPTADLESILYTTDKNQLNQAYLNAGYITKLPQFRDPAAFMELQKKVNENWVGVRGKDPLVLGQVTNDGRVIPTQDPRVIAVASEILSKGNLMNDAEAEKDEAALALTRAQTSKALRENSSGSKPTAEQLKENQYRKEVESQHKEVKKVFGDQYFKNALKSPLLDKIGNATDYKVFAPLPATVAGRFIGVESPEESVATKDEEGGTTTTVKKKGGSMKVDGIYPVENKKTGERELVYLKDGNIVSKVNKKTALINGLKDISDFDAKIYETRLPYVEEVIAETAQPRSGTSATSFTPKLNGAVVQVQMQGGIPMANVGGRWRKIKSKNSQTGEIKVE